MRPCTVVCAVFRVGDNVVAREAVLLQETLMGLLALQKDTGKGPGRKMRQSVELGSA